VSRVIRTAVLTLLTLLVLAGAVVLPALLRPDMITYQWAGGLGTGTLTQPIGLAYLEGRLYASDVGENRIVVFDTAGALLHEWDGKEEGLRRPMQLHLGSDRRLYVPEYLTDRITVLESVGGDDPGRVLELEATKRPEASDGRHQAD